MAHIQNNSETNKESAAPAMLNRGEKMGTSKTNDVVVRSINTDCTREDHTNSVTQHQHRQEYRRDQTESAHMIQQQNASSNVQTTAEAAVIDDEQMQMMIALTQTISTLGGKFEQMG